MKIMVFSSGGRAERYDFGGASVKRELLERTDVYKREGKKMGANEQRVPYRDFSAS